MFGSYDSDEARILQIRLNRCTGSDCASETTINNYFKGMMVGIFANRIRFDSEYFSEESVKQESEFYWNPVST